MNKFEIESAILQHINKDSAKFYSNYYVGISNDPSKRLFDEHNVDEKAGCWIYCQASNHKEARSAEKSLLDRGMKGGPGGGNDDSLFVYCYRITDYTVE